MTPRHRRSAWPVTATLLAMALCVLPGCASANDASLDALKGLAPAEGPSCHPDPDPSATQFVTGYGSLMQRASRTSTAPQATGERPVELTGYRRGFFARGAMPGVNTVFLGVLPQAGSTINAVIFELPATEVAAMDAREYVYCRVLVPATSISMLDGRPVPSGQVWIYENTAASIGLAAPDVPIVQSYVDIFLSGCLELQARFRLADFAEQCVRSTSDWSQHWVNDRLFPRRPTANFPQAMAVDTLLKRLLPEEFSAIRIE